ncbi:MULTISPECIES: LLM class flavin-dependent oxidoreductase [unclassified Haematobacter]|uniref:LLM class flavin-dependent oxidoreductase n=1 Tax=unclassified Haematobacter TaxID=2640585 RepID=UPI0025C2CF9F|nr:MULTISPECIES: LLM class flavin-dependent oxidoreductase [unclassified Haematobacter]
MDFDHIAFLVPGNYAEEDPFTGLEATLRLFELGERLGYDSGWVRQRHLERGISSAATFLAAASQRTRSIGLGTAVIQLGYEHPFRLAEDLATVDVLSRGRLNVGVSVGHPPFAALIGGYPVEGDYGHTRAEELARLIASPPLSPERVAGNASGAQVPRLQPVARGLSERLWYGGGSQRSAVWAGGAGFHLLTGNIVSGEGTDDFLTAQRRLIDAFRRAGGGRVGLGRVILPTDSADFATRRRYVDFARSRHARTLEPQGARRTLFLPDIVGTVEEIAALLSRDPVAATARELRLELPYELAVEDYEQILTDMARLLPEWRSADQTTQKEAV